MGLFDKFMKLVKVKSGQYLGISVQSPPFDKTAWQQDTFRATVDAIASHGAKAQFQAVVEDTKTGRVKQVIRNDPMARLLNEHPNNIMTGTEFKYRMLANLETKNTAVAYVQWDGSRPKAIYPVDYTRYEFKQIVGGGIAIEFIDYEGSVRALPLECCIVIRKFYNDRLAAGDGNGPVYRVLDMAKTSDEGFIESLAVSNKIRGILKQKRSLLDPEDVKKGQDEFAKRLEDAAKSGGVIAVDSMEEYTPLTVNAYAANAEQMEAVNKRIFNYLRTPEKIVNGSYSEQEGLAWREGKLVPIWNTFAEAVSNVYFTRHERECGNRIIMVCPVMTGMSVESIVKILNATKETGELTTNERRELLGYAPVEGGDERQISLNFVKGKDQSSYQTGKEEEKENGNGSEEGQGNQKDDGLPDENQEG